MRYGIPRYRLPREVLDAEVARILSWASPSSASTRRRHRRRRWRRAASTRASSPSARRSAKRAYIPAGDAARILDAVEFLRGVEEGEAPRSAAGSPSTAAATRRSTPRGRPGAWAPMRPASSTGATASTCRRTPPRSGSERGGRASCAGCDDPRRATRVRLTLERMELDEQGFPQPTGELEELDADTLVLALGQDVDLVAARWRAGRSRRGRRRRGRRAHDDRPRRALRGR